MSTLSIRGMAAGEAERLSKRIRIADRAIADADDNWRATTSALINGANSETGSQDSARLLRPRYTAIKRLTSEARRMILLSTAPERRQAVYAIDPHLIHGYCSFWEPTNFTAFDFLRGEWGDEDEGDRTRFIVYLLGSILRMNDLICLEAGREEIANMLARFLEAHQQSRELNSQEERDKQVASFAGALAEIQRAAEFSDRLNVSPENISKFILEKFEALVGAGGIPLMQQQLSAARLAQVLRSGALKATFFALRSKLNDEAEALSTAEGLFTALRRDDEFLRSARTSFYRAFSTFARSTQLPGVPNRFGDNVAQFSPGQFSNINALFELHVLNVCLSEAGVRARVRYITDSATMFSFVSAFLPDTLEVELVHPRHVFIFENRLTDGNLDKFQQVLGAPDAFAEKVDADGMIRPSELDRFEQNYTGMLRDVRSTYSFAAVDFLPAREALADVMRWFIRDHGGARSEELNSNLADIAGRLASTSESVRQAFGSTVAELTEQGFDAYKEFVETLSGETRRTLMLARRFSGNSEKPGAIPRLVCVPVGGGYRQIVKIYQPDVVRHLGEYDRDVGAIDVSMLVTSIKDILSKADRSGWDANEASVASALPHYARALYAMVGREWLLAQTYCKSALRILDFADQASDFELRQVGGNSAEARRRLMIQEVLIVQHFARRGIASNLEAVGRRRRWLMLAAQDLLLAGRLVASVSDRDSYATAYNPNSVRLALATMGMLIEWLALKVNRRAMGRPLDTADGGAILPATEQGDLAWFGLETLVTPLAAHWADPDAGTKVRADLDLLNERILEILPFVEEGCDNNGHSYEFWRYIAVRGLGLRSLVDLLGRLQLIEVGEFVPSLQHTAANLALFQQHEEYIDGRRRAFNGSKTDVSLPVHPFNDLINTAHLLLDLPDDDGSPLGTTKLRRGELLLSISRLHYTLSATGFPRSISRALLSRYGAEAAIQLRDVADLLEREALFADGVQ